MGVLLCYLPMAIKIEILGNGSERKAYSFDKNVITIGRTQDNDGVIDSSQVSKCHCRLTLKDGTVEIEDLNSTNGVRVNGKLVTKALLASGDQFRLSFAVPPFQLTLDSALELHDLGFTDPSAPKPAAFEEDSSPTMVGQAMLDDAIREQIARNAARRGPSSEPEKTSEQPRVRMSPSPSRPVQPPASPIVSSAPVSKPNNGPILLGIGIFLILVLLLFLVLGR